MRQSDCRRIQGGKEHAGGKEAGRRDKMTRTARSSFLLHSTSQPFVHEVCKCLLYTASGSSIEVGHLLTPDEVQSGQRSRGLDSSESVLLKKGAFTPRDTMLCPHWHSCADSEPYHQIPTPPCRGRIAVSPPPMQCYPLPLLLFEQEPQP